MIFTSPVALLFSLAITMSVSTAAPIVLSSVSERDVWAPKVTSPNAGTVWPVGSSQTVTWYVEIALPYRYGVRALFSFNVDPRSRLCDRDTSNRPSQVTNPKGTLLLGHLNDDGSGGENLDVGQLIFFSNTGSIFAYHTTRHLYLDHPLADGFQLDAGSVPVTVPSVDPKNNYIVVRAYLMLTSIFVLFRDPYSGGSYRRLG
jgi:hypothetical protein